MNRFLWVIQILLMLLFLFNGTSKLRMPDEQLTAGSSFSAGFLHFIAVCEILGALGLVLPRLFRTAVWLTPLAAALLVIIMIGATISTLGAGPIVGLPIVAGVLCIVVAWGRWRVAR